jgi:predicted nucleic acid-binding protein
MPRRLRVTLVLVQLAGKIEGEQAAKGLVIVLPDLLIGATALYLGYFVATLNTRHFRLIPGLSVRGLIRPLDNRQSRRCPRDSEFLTRVLPP